MGCLYLKYRLLLTDSPLFMGLVQWKTFCFVATVGRRSNKAPPAPHTQSASMRDKTAGAHICLGDTEPDSGWLLWCAGSSYISFLPCLEAFASGTVISLLVTLKVLVLFSPADVSVTMSLL